MKVLIAIIVIIVIYHASGVELRHGQQEESNYDDMETTDLSTIPETSLRILKESLHINKTGGRFIYVAGEDGTLHLIDTHDVVNTAAITDYFNTPNLLLLYTRANKDTPQYLMEGDAESVTKSNFDAAKVTVLLVHGWLGDANTNMNIILTKAFLNNSDCNVIILDWSKLANNLNYITVKAGTAAVGRSLGQFAKWMVEKGFTMYHKIHLVGFSLGGQLVGNAGRETESAVQRITALDPAGPLWYNDKERLVASDGQYVEVIHTNTKWWGWLGWALGYKYPCGDADFYPNGGELMPGCSMNTCSHYRAYEYMESSLMNDHFMASECHSYNEMLQDKCTGSVSYMGNSDLQKSKKGLFRVNTKKEYPY